jgi:hypothetical protein
MILNTETEPIVKPETEQPVVEPVRRRIWRPKPVIIPQPKH